MLISRLLFTILCAPADDAPEGGGGTKPETPAKPDAPTPKDADGYHAAFKAMQADVARVESENKSWQKKHGDVEKERDTLRAQLENFTKRDREGALLDKLRADLPHAEPLALRGTLAALAEQGRIDRYPMAEKLEEVAKAARELIEKEAPSLARPPAGGGVNGAPRQKTSVTKETSPLDAAFGARK